MSAKERDIKAREYCDETGSMYFEYTDASNELIDAYSSAWDYQQQKIDEVKAENEKLKENLREIIGTMKNNHSYHGEDNSWKCNDEDCVGCLYERRYLKEKENE